MQAGEGIPPIEPVRGGGVWGWLRPTHIFSRILKTLLHAVTSLQSSKYRIVVFKLPTLTPQIPLDYIQPSFYNLTISLSSLLKSTKCIPIIPRTFYKYRHPIMYCTCIFRIISYVIWIEEPYLMLRNSYIVFVIIVCSKNINTFHFCL